MSQKSFSKERNHLKLLMHNNSALMSAHGASIAMLAIKLPLKIIMNFNFSILNKRVSLPVPELFSSNMV